MRELEPIGVRVVGPAHERAALGPVAARRPRGAAVAAVAASVVVAVVVVVAREGEQAVGEQPEDDRPFAAAGLVLGAERLGGVGAGLEPELEQIAAAREIVAGEQELAGRRVAMQEAGVHVVQHRVVLRAASEEVAA